jgi:hypothetical protein
VARRRLSASCARPCAQIAQAGTAFAPGIGHLWLFLKEQGVAPTNNHAERTLRFAVLWRKRSFGTRVDKGERFVERILSLRQTCRLQSKRVYPYIPSLSMPCALFWKA